MRHQARAFGAVSRLTRRPGVAALTVLCLLGTPVAASTLPEIRALAAEQRYSEALKQLDALLEANSGDVEARLFRGDVYAKLARIAYERAFTLNENNTGAKDKASWMTRVLDTEPGVSGEIPPEAGAEPPNLETKAADPTELQVMSKAEAEATAGQIAAACYAADGIENRFAAQSVANWFTTRGVNASEQTRSAQNSVFYEVYVPPLKSRAAANEEMRRMREDDFVDIMRINSGKLENGVAVGAYRKLGNAERRIKTFRAKGYQVEFKPRGETRSTYWFAVSAGTSGELRNQFSSTFPDYPLSESPCR